MDKDKGVFMTAREVNMEIEMLKTVFDIVRLVDVSRTAPVNIGSDDCSYEAEHKCFAVWNKGRRCENCISAKVFARKNRMTKFEFVNDDIYQVIAKYVVIDGTPLVMEMVFKMTDKIFLGAYGSGSLIDKISRFNRELYEDPLTGARNRRYFEEQLKSLDKMGAIAMIDVDNFKQINDSYGHVQGDLCLAEIAECIKKAYANFGYCYRIGGDEFCVLLKNRAKEEECKQEFLRRWTEKRRKFIFFPTVSYGSAPVSGEDIAVVKDRADRDMYQYKKERKKHHAPSLTDV